MGSSADWAVHRQTEFSRKILCNFPVAFSRLNLVKFGRVTGRIWSSLVQFGLVELVGFCSSLVVFVLVEFGRFRSILVELSLVDFGRAHWSQFVGLGSPSPEDNSQVWSSFLSILVDVGRIWSHVVAWGLPENYLNFSNHIL